jgi:hypothetical protein
MKQRNSTWGCPRIAQQIALAFEIHINKDVVRRILAARYQPEPDSAGPSWLRFNQAEFFNYLSLRGLVIRSVVHVVQMSAAAPGIDSV